jgi:hypothetical protein
MIDIENKLRVRIQELTKENIHFTKNWDHNTIISLKVLVDLEIPFNIIRDYNDIKTYTLMD